MTNTNTLPPIIENMLETINDPKTPDYQRYNTKLTLLAIQQGIDKALKKFDRDLDRRTGKRYK